MQYIYHFTFIVQNCRLSANIFKPVTNVSVSSGPIDRKLDDGIKKSLSSPSAEGMAFPSLSGAV